MNALRVNLSVNYQRVNREDPRGGDSVPDIFIEAPQQHECVLVASAEQRLPTQTRREVSVAQQDAAGEALG